MNINKAIQQILFGINHGSSADFETNRINELAEALADPSLGGVNIEQENSLPDETLKISRNFQLLMALLKSHDHRREFWKRKLSNLLKNCNRQWMLDQFNLCKLFLLGNSFFVEKDEIDESYTKNNPYLEKVYNKCIGRTIADSNSRRNSEELENLKDQKIGSEKSTKTQIINLTSMIGFIVGYEKKLREVCRLKLDKKNNSIDKITIKELQKDNQKKLKRFFSSNFSACIKAFQDAKDKL